ncbi:EamA family transporter [Clostridiaceae bacterium 14S0207]|nr:EamA family transporter [Clostridiaceae bacterium 14S0207]
MLVGDFYLNKKQNFLTKPYTIISFALIACFLWGSAFPSIKIGYILFEIEKNDTYSKLLFAGYRFFISSIMIFLFCKLKGISLKLTKDKLLQVSILGMLQTFIQYMLFYIGLSNVTGVKGSIISSSSTFFTVILAHFFYKEDKINLQKFLGVILGFTGVIIVNMQKGNLTGGFTFTGEGFLVLSSIFGAFAGIYTKKLTKTINPFVVSGYQLFTGSIGLILISLIGGAKTLNFTTGGSILLIYMGFISAMAFSLWSLLLKYNGVGKISIYKFSIPLFGVLLSYTFLKESFQGVRVLISIILVSIGIILINKEKKHI